MAFKRVKRSFYETRRGKSMDNFVGGIYVLSALPIWATAAIIFAITLTVIFIGREILEGIPYNIAYSAVIGDVGLTIGVLIGATILHREGVHIPQWLQNIFIHLTILLGSVLFGIIICESTLDSRSGQVMDIYHDVIIAPLLLYLAITLLPIIFINSTRVEIISTLCFILLWIALVVFDIRYGRINQRRWLQSHGVTLKKPNF